MALRPTPNTTYPADRRRGRLGRVVAYERGVGTIKGERRREIKVHFSVVSNPRLSGEELHVGDRVRYEPTGEVSIASWVYRLPDGDGE